MKKIRIFFAAMVMLALSATALAQNITVKGTVKDGAGEGIVGASLVLKSNNTVYTMTDAAGAFSLSVPADGVLEVNCMGYEPVLIPVNGHTTLNIVLKDDAQLLEETIVVAFGTATKESFTGSAKVVNSESLSNSQVAAVTSALAGKVAGVQLTTSSGAPGSSPSIRIRGFSSISAGQEPLYVVDGMPYDGDINNINPADVESMTVLKDAASNALYGARGANGVIMITTKRAKESNAIVTVDAKWGVNSRALQPYETISDPGLYYETHYAALVNYYMDKRGMSASAAGIEANKIMGGAASAGGLGYISYTVPEGELLIGRNGKLNPNATLGNKVNYEGQDYLILPDNWMAEGYRQSLRQEYNVSVAGGGEKSNFYASVGYLNNQGIAQNSDMQRFTARLKADYQAKRWLKVYGNMSYTKFNYNSLSNEGSSNSTGNIWAYTTQMAPIYPLWVRDGEGNIMVDSNGIKLMDYGDGMNAGLIRDYFKNSNAIQQSRLDTHNAEGNAFSATGAADFTFLKDFKFTVNASTAIDETRSTSVSNPYFGQFASAGGTVGKTHTRSTDFNTQQLLNYSHSFANRMNLNVMVGHEYYVSKAYSLYGAKQKMFSQENKELDGAVVDNKSASSSVGTYNNEGYFSRVQFDDNNTIFLSASFRRDASSKFSKKHQWGNFWSVGAAWILSKESWFNASWVDMLKLKASYGSQGNDGISSYLYTDTYDIIPLNGEVATGFNSKGKEDITWETNGNFNIGTEFTLFGNKLDGSFEFFNRKTTDMLFRFTVPSSMGYTGYYDNVGDMKNYGIEFALTYNVIQKKNVHWSIDLNATHLKNRILYLHDDVKTRTIEGYEGYNSGSYFYGEGLPLYTYYMKKYAGVDQNTGESLWYKDITDADGNVTGKETTNNYSSATEYLCGNPTPLFYGGFGTSFYCYGFDFNVNFSYQIGGLSYDSGYSQFMTAPISSSTGANFHKDVLKAWTVENPSTTIPRWQYDDTYVAATSDRFLTNASYLNIENINIGYTFPSKWTTKLGVSSLRIYGSCENVFYWSARKGFDPRYSFSGGTNYSNYSPVRTISGGITLKF